MILLISHKVDIVKEEAERQRMQREELEVELQKVRQQMLNVLPSGKSKSSMEDGMVDLADLSRSLYLAVLLHFLQLEQKLSALTLMLLQTLDRYS